MGMGIGGMGIDGIFGFQVMREDGVTKRICEECKERVQLWHGYRNSCRRAQEVLGRWSEKRGQVSFDGFWGLREIWG